MSSKGKRSRTATGRLLGVLGVFWLNMVVAPCAMAFGAEHDIKVVTVADLIRYRLQNERLVECVGQARMPTQFGEFTLRCFENVIASCSLALPFPRTS